FFGITVPEQLHRAFEVCEEHRDLLAFAFERGLGGEDLLRGVPGRVGVRRGEARLSGLGERRGALAAELVRRRVGGSARRADGGERRGALAAESRSGGVLGL